jgi:hypothetical protein
MFLNLGDVNLHDTAQLNMAAVSNAGRLTAFGSAVRANLVDNIGLVDVVAGSTLSAPLFDTNAGTVQVDGTLRVGPNFLLTDTAFLAAATGSTFTNLSSGMLTGNGSIIVNGGVGTVDNFGTIAPGGVGTVGTLALGSNLIMEGGSTLATDIVTTGSHDVLQVSGTATTGGSVAVSYQSGTMFSSGESFRVLQAGALDASSLPPVDKPELVSAASGNDMLLVAIASYPSSTVVPPTQTSGEQQSGARQVDSQVVTFSQFFTEMFEQQNQEDKKDTRFGKDDIVITDTACK